MKHFLIHDQPHSTLGMVDFLSTAHYEMRTRSIMDKAIGLLWDACNK